MNGISEALAELGQGTALASAVEPEAVQGQGERHDGHTHEADCLNCRTHLVGSHCHACGQAAHVHRTLGAFFHDLLHGVFHFEGKIWRTLPLLAWRPGRLTREYIEGRRASYVSPIALFLFCVFLMFAVFHATEGHEEPVAQTADSQGVGDSIKRLEGEIAGVEGKKKAAAAQGQPTAQFEYQLKGQRTALDTLRDIEAEGVDRKVDPTRKVSDIPALDKAIKKFRSNPDLASYKIQTYAYKYSWALIPISVPFLWLLFPFSRRFHLYDHTVFVTYSLCFMTLLAIVGMIAGAIGVGGLVAALVLTPPLHMYRQLRGAYAVGRVGALWRTAVLLIFAAMALGVFFTLLMAQTSM
ncbi:DUF3667 domain-containing protein [Novosphingobium resinovorum]|uniref:DUF3667 domain-containing protein n=1 Tax=Novosphingobium resinovorum TaxID=158500 RepID=A0A1D8A089_9SPHN|nr:MULTISPECIES: DUF3667 domain-containing protein [Novosphingobium]AOR75480.1 hypothetical protein BES08_00930 [Novosphingobium resinovorum]MBF7010795.1 DUF3667 domain-containing protein [Novosphingobium sp. HR1a]WJM28790.1 DUF3667 domain-containing protein [Novosphingobium resinovorum]